MGRGITAWRDHRAWIRDLMSIIIKHRFTYIILIDMLMYGQIYEVAGPNVTSKRKFPSRCSCLQSRGERQAPRWS